MYQPGAYLVATLEQDRGSAASMPRVVSVDIFSAPWEGLTLRHAGHLSYANVMWWPGDSYAEAKEKLLRSMEAMPNLQWAVDYMRRRGPL